MVLLAIALLGLVVGDGLFFYWLFTEFTTVSAVLDNHLALAFIIDVTLTLAVLTWHFARQPRPPLRWPWFVALSLAGGLCFSVPLWLWLSDRRGKA